MKKSNLFRYVATLLAFCMFLCCQKTDTPATPAPGKGHIVETVQASIAGRITDDQQAPVAGARVTVGLTQTTTDINGTFSFDNLRVDRTATLVAVEKEGFFEGLRTIIVTEGKQHEVSIQLLKRTLAGSFSGSVGGTIHIPDAGGAIAFEANTLMNPANRSGYTGTVTVHAAFINPTAPNFQEILPGTLRGIDVNNNIMGLQSFGMMAVELSGANGEKLQLAGGKKATMRFPIPATLLGEAPATIPLWFLNDSTGLWQEEGFATRIGGEYVGQVGHFSFWNVDAPFPVIEFSATIKGSQQLPLAGTLVTISSSNGISNISGSGYTNAEGVASGLIPANKTLELKVIDQCGNVLHSQPIGPFSANTNLGTISVASGNVQVEIKGTVANCNMAAVTNGIANITVDNRHYAAKIESGRFSLLIDRCNATPAIATITAFDITASKSSAPMSITITDAPVATGELLACGDMPDEFIQSTIDGKSFVFTSTEHDIKMGKSTDSTGVNTHVSCTPKGDSSKLAAIFFSFAKEEIGEQTAKSWNLSDFAVNHYWSGSNITLHFTSYTKTADGYLTGSFSGESEDRARPGTTATVSGSFRIKYKL